MKLTILPFLFLIFTNNTIGQEPVKVLIEVFTNSHCPLCPPSHQVVEDYLNGPNGDRISYIFYHMVYPYSDDQLYVESKLDSDSRDEFYDPVPFTPQGWIQGFHQSGSYFNWPDTIDEKLSELSPFIISLSGIKNENSAEIQASVTRTGDITSENLTLNFVVVEDLFYDGRNSVSDHKHVMRKMLPSARGEPFTINLNETKIIEQKIDFLPIWDSDSLSIVVFIQDTVSKIVYQSETISTDQLSVTGTAGSDLKPVNFSLSQNYPNPFNPITKIRYDIPASEFKNIRTRLIVYDILGNEITVLVNVEKPPGTYEIEFSAEGNISIASGIYLYRLISGDFSDTKKMILLR